MNERQKNGKIESIKGHTVNVIVAVEAQADELQLHSLLIYRNI